MTGSGERAGKEGANSMCRCATSEGLLVLGGEGCGEVLWELLGDVDVDDVGCSPRKPVVSDLLLGGVDATRDEHAGTTVC